MQAHLLTTVDPLDTGSLLVGRYRILAKVGEGGFGVVYQSRDTQHRGRLVAIKQIDLGALSPRQIIEATDSYNREVTILSRLHHRNLPRIYDHFTDPTHWYLVMQYIEGETLDDSFKGAKDGHLSMKEVLSIGIQLCKVLAYLHSHNPPIIFRDVKPANIMRTRRGRLYLIDFGIARRFSPEKRRDTGPLGSPGYAAPEQYGRAQSTEQTDIYGLGATLQTLLTGRELLEDDPAKPSTKPLDQTTQQLQHLLDAMQAPDATNRPRSMQEVKARLLFLRHHRTRFVSLGHKAFSFLIGLLIGSVPYLCFLFGRAFFYSASDTRLPSFLILLMMPFMLLSYLFFLFWQGVLVCQCVAAIFLFVARPRRPLIACGILIMLALIYLAVLLGWLPSVSNFFQPHHPGT